MSRFKLYLMWGKNFFSHVQTVFEERIFAKVKCVTNYRQPVLGCKEDGGRIFI